MIKAEGIGKQGRSRTPQQNAVALRHVAAYVSHGLSLDVSIKTAAAAECASPHTLRTALQQYTATGTLPSPSTSHRGRGNPNHPLHSPAEPDFDLEICIHRIMHEQIALKAKHIAVKHIQQQLLEEYRTFVSIFTLTRWMHELEYTWDDKKFIGSLTPQYRNSRIRSFIWHYAEALRLQRQGTHIIVYLDESYIHALHQMKKGWHPKSGPYRNNETQGDVDTGKRLIIMHAMSKDGMLEVENAVGSNFLHEVTPTAQFVFEAASFDDSDYHTTIDGDAFTLWVKNRLLPAFDALYPGKKMIIVMDNASYHKPRDFDWITSYDMDKTECVSFLKAHRVKEFTAQREGVEVTFKQTQFSKRSSKTNGAPTVKELQQAVKAHLKQHPGINKTRIDKLLQPRGDFIVWTPPFVPEVQPIEMIWGQVKNEVAAQYTLKRTIDMTREQTDDALDRITPAMIQKRIDHCHRWINDFLQSEEAGSLRQFGSLQQLIVASSNAPLPSDLVAPSFQEAEAEEEEELEEP